MNARFLQLTALGIDTRCAADLLRYFQRHPTAYVTTDELASYVGYVSADVEGGISALTRAGLLVRRHHRKLKAAMHRLVPGESVSELARAASSASGWQELRRGLRSHERSRRAAVADGAAEAGVDGARRQRVSVNGARLWRVSGGFVDVLRLCEDHERLSNVAQRQRTAAMKMRADAKRMTVRALEMMVRASAARGIVGRPRAK